MCIESIDRESDFSLNRVEKIEEGSDNLRTYTILSSREYCNQCLNDLKLSEFGIEKITYQVYKLAEAIFFDITFKVSLSDGKTTNLQFSHRGMSPNDNIDFFSNVAIAAANVGAVGLATLADRATLLASFPPDKDSQYLRCMEGCDRIELEPLKYLCYLACTIWGNKDPGS